MDLTDEELDYTRLAKHLLNMTGLKDLEKRYKDKPKVINEVYKQMIITKHKTLYKILCFIERTITILTLLFLIIFIVGEPIGEYTFKIFLLKILAIIGFYVITKIEG